MKRFKRTLLGAVTLLLLGSGLGLWYFDDPHQRTRRLIRKRLLQLAEATSFKENDPPFARLAYAPRVTDFFGEAVELDITLGPRSAQETISRPNLRDGLTALRHTNRGLNVEFMDIVVNLASPPTHATAHLTSKIYFLGDPDYFVQEFRVDLEKPADDWLIRGVATVKTME